jgi:hypothetical protein
LNGSNVHGSWTEIEKQKSSTWRELEAIHRVLRSNLQILHKNNVVFYTDNMNVKF